MSNQVGLSKDARDKYLLFLLGEELYGTPLTGVKEVIEYQKAKPIPNMVEYFEGVINLRGDVVGVLDLRKKVGVEGGLATSMLVFETDRGPLAAIVDRAYAVASMGESEIDRKPNVRSKFAVDYFFGVGKYNDRLVTIVDLRKILTDEELVRVNQAI